MWSATSVRKPTSSQRYDVPFTSASVRGPEDAPVTIIEFLDFQCPICRKQHRQSFSELREQYGEQVRWVILNFPMHEMHRQARPAAIAAVRQ